MNAVAETDLLALSNRTWCVGAGDLDNSGSESRELGGQFHLDVEAGGFERELLHVRSADGLVGRFHIGQFRVERDIRKHREEPVCKATFPAESWHGFEESGTKTTSASPARIGAMRSGIRAGESSTSAS